MAQAYSAGGHPDKAIEEYRLALVFDPNSALIYARIATEYMRKGIQSSAIEACKEAVRLDPKFVDARLMLAGLYSSAGDSQSAIQQYEAVLKQEPTHEEAAMYKAQVLFEEDRGPDAAKFLRAFLKKVPAPSAASHYYLGRIEAQLEHYQESEKQFKKAVEINDDFHQAHLALGFLYESQNKLKQAKVIYKDLWDRARDIAAANRLATLYLKETNYKEAAIYLEGIQQSDPDDLNARVKLGLVYMELKKYGKAVPVFEEILKKSPESDRVRFYLGSLYEELEEFGKATGEFRQIPQDSKYYSDASLHAAYILKQTGKRDEARKILVKLLEQPQKNPSFYLLMATLDEEAGAIDGAILTMEKAVGFFDDDEKSKYYLGSLYDKKGETRKSIAIMEEILKQNPNNADALNYLGYTWTVQGIRLEDAEKVLRKAVALKPDNAYIVDSWGWYLFARGRVLEAVLQLEKAVKLKPTESTILEHLADAYVRANFMDRAVAVYESALRFAEDPKLKGSVEEKLRNISRQMAETPKTAPVENRSPASR